MDETGLIRTLVAVAEAPVDPPVDFQASMWETLLRELTADARPSGGFGEAAAVDVARPGLSRQAPQRIRRPGGVWAAVATFTLVVAVGLAVWAIRPQEPAGEITDSPPATVPAISGDADPDLDEGASISGIWSQAATVLGRDEYVPRVFEIDHRVLVIHEQNQGTTVAGEFYDPVANEARPIADSGLVWRANAAMVWTGTELLIVGGSNGPGIDQLGAAYNPSTDTWRLLPDPPGSVDAWDNSITGPAVWTGTEMLIPAHGLAFNPVVDRWRTFTPQPGPRRTRPAAAWNGTEFIVWGGCDAAVPQCDDFERGLLTDGLAYNPDDDTWRSLAPSPLAPGVHPTAEWSRYGLLVYAGTGHSDEGATFARYDPENDRWGELADPPLAPRRYTASDYDHRAFVLWGGSADPEREFSDGAIYDDETDTWRPLPAAPNGAARDRHAMTWVAGRLYVTGGYRTLGPLLFTPGDRQADVLETTSTTVAPTTTSLPSVFPATRSDIGLGWESVEVPPVVALCHGAVVGTDTELIFWGGNQQSCDYESPIGDPGMAYNPDTGMWRQLSPSPLEPVVAPSGVWTGSEVIICCGMTSRQTAAYDPANDTWRSLAEAPLSGPFPVAAWTGEEMIVVTQRDVAAYDPATDTWRSFSSPPESLGRTNQIVWTGAEIVVWPVAPVGDPQRRVERGISLDPTTGTWRVLPDPPEWPSWLSMVFTGDSLIVWGGLPAHSVGSERAVGSSYDLDTDTWTALPEALPEPDGCECNLGSQTLTWTGEYVLVSPGRFSSGVDPETPVLIAYHPETDSWILVDENSPIAWGGNSLNVGERLAISAGGTAYLSPPNWQPTGVVITQDTWEN